jgi:hypothetical protein
MQSKPNIHPANSIRHAYLRYEYVCANTIGVVTVSPYWLKFAALRLFVMTSPNNKDVASGNGNRLFTEKRHVQIANNSIAKMPDRS